MSNSLPVTKFLDATTAIYPAAESRASLEVLREIGSQIARSDDGGQTVVKAVDDKISQNVALAKRHADEAKDSYVKSKTEWKLVEAMERDGKKDTWVCRDLKNSAENDRSVAEQQARWAEQELRSVEFWKAAMPDSLRSSSYFKLSTETKRCDQ